MAYDASLINWFSAHKCPNEEYHTVCVCCWRLNPRDWFELLCLNRNPRAFNASYMPLICQVGNGFLGKLYVCAPGSLIYTAFWRLLQRRIGPDCTKYVATFIIGGAETTHYNTIARNNAISLNYQQLLNEFFTSY